MTSPRRRPCERSQGWTALVRLARAEGCGRSSPVVGREVVPPMCPRQRVVAAVAQPRCLGHRQERVSSPRRPKRTKVRPVVSRGWAQTRIARANSLRWTTGAEARFEGSRSRAPMRTCHVSPPRRMQEQLPGGSCWREAVLPPPTFPRCWRWAVVESLRARALQRMFEAAWMSSRQPRLESVSPPCPRRKDAVGVAQSVSPHRRATVARVHSHGPHP